MADKMTELKNLVDPEVMGDTVSARLEKKLRVAPFAKIDDTLNGVPGDTITVPAYTYIGDATDVAEGAEVSIEQMTTSIRKATIKKAMKGVGITDEAVLCGYGNAVGEAAGQITMSIAAKIDNDCMDQLQTAKLIYNGKSNEIDYDGIVDAVDLFEDEVGYSDKAMFIHPKQATQLRKCEDFISADKYQSGVAVTGEMGLVAGCRLVISKKVRRVAYAVDADGTITVTTDNFEQYREQVDGTLKVGDKLKALTAGTEYYCCPIVKLENEEDMDDEIPALTIYRKRDVNIEAERKPKTRSTEITADEFYVAVLSNESKVVLAKFKA